jgi:tRNA-dihydrouridine synthase 3
MPILRLTSINRYLLTIETQFTPDDDAAEGSRSHANISRHHDDGRNEDQARGPLRKKLSKEQKKAQRGANKGRRFGKVRDDLDLCWRIAVGAVCEFGEE